ncbi:hypothetical protein [Corynebacterium kalidii]
MATKNDNIETAKKAGKALKAEAAASTEPVDIVLTINGEDVTVAAPATVEAAHWRVPLLMQSGTNQDIAKAIPLILGAEGCELLDSAGATFNDLNKFLDLWSEEIGMGE